MKILILVLCSLVVEIHCCWSKSAKTTPTKKPTTNHQTPVEDKISASDVVKLNTQVSANSNVRTSELKDFSQELYQTDSNSLGSKLKVDLQGKLTRQANNDASPNPLFPDFTPRLLQGSTWGPFHRLLDNYLPYVSAREDDTKSEKDEVTSFLNAIMSTPVMKKTEQFLQKKRLIKGPLLPQLHFIWFTPYSRHRNVVGSSGFEHVFLGEIKNGKVSGFHSWLFLQEEEKEKDLNYKGYLNFMPLGNKGKIMSITFDWMGKTKQAGTIFVGTSPELEIALYTLCFYARPNKNCNLKIDNSKFSIKVYEQKYRGRKMIGSAFPQIY